MDQEADCSFGDVLDSGRSLNFDHLKIKNKAVLRSSNLLYILYIYHNYGCKSLCGAWNLYVFFFFLAIGVVITAFLSWNINTPPQYSKIMKVCFQTQHPYCEEQEHSRVITDDVLHVCHWRLSAARLNYSMPVKRDPSFNARASCAVKDFTPHRNIGCHP